MKNAKGERIGDEKKFYGRFVVANEEKCHETSERSVDQRIWIANPEHRHDIFVSVQIGGGACAFE